MKSDFNPPPVMVAVFLIRGRRKPFFGSCMQHLHFAQSQGVQSSHTGTTQHEHNEQLTKILHIVKTILH